VIRARHAVHGGYNAVYCASTGLAPTARAAAIEEWLAAPNHRQGSVRWLDDDVLAMPSFASARAFVNAITAKNWLRDDVS
jgi:hypothetical protein